MTRKESEKKEQSSNKLLQLKWTNASNGWRPVFRLWGDNKGQLLKATSLFQPYWLHNCTLTLDSTIKRTNTRHGFDYSLWIGWMKLKTIKMAPICLSVFSFGLWGIRSPIDSRARRHRCSPVPRGMAPMRMLPFSYPLRCVVQCEPLTNWSLT